MRLAVEQRLAAATVAQARAAVTFLYRRVLDEPMPELGGLRLLEALTLRVKDVALERGELRLRRAKGRRIG